MAKSNGNDDTASSRGTSRTVETEILDPATEHDYDNPSLSPQEFLLAVMHSKRLPLSARIDAASKVAVYLHPRLAQVNQDVTAGLTITINGGLPQLPGTNIIMPSPNGKERDPIDPPAKANGRSKED